MIQGLKFTENEPCNSNKKAQTLNIVTNKVKGPLINVRLVQNTPLASMTIFNSS